MELEPRPASYILNLQDLQGRPAALVRPRGKALLLYVWGTWCPSCQVDLQRVAHAHGHVAGFGIAIETRPASAAAAFLRMHEAALRVFQDPRAEVLPAQRPDETASPFRRWSLPLTFAVDREGRVRGYTAGSIDWPGRKAPLSCKPSAHITEDSRS